MPPNPGPSGPPRPPGGSGGPTIPGGPGVEVPEIPGGGSGPPTMPAERVAWEQLVELQIQAASGVAQFNVPHDHRLVIDFVTGHVVAPAGNRIVRLTVGPDLFKPTRHHLVLHHQGSESGSDHFSICHPIGGLAVEGLRAVDAARDDSSLNFGLRAERDDANDGPIALSLTFFGYAVRRPRT